MPLLDVTDVLFDPDFCQTFRVVTEKVTINDMGVALPTEVTERASGVVVPVSSQELMRLPEGEMLSGSIRVFTTYPLHAGGGDLKACKVIVGHRSYVVRMVDDYTAFGVGYVAALCAALSVRNDIR